MKSWPRKAFTLVELLVVIGIIAILIGVLLPALASARRQAGAIKCCASLREIGNAFQMYAIDSKGWYPPSQIQVQDPFKYNVDGTDYNDSQGYGAYWFTFLAKYVTKARMGTSSVNDVEAAQAKQSIFWGCPSWDGYNSSPGIGYTDYNRIQLGYGMTWWPLWTAYYPRPPAGSYMSTITEYSFIQNWNPKYPSGVGNPAQTGRWFKQKVYTAQGASRLLIADSRFWAVESLSVPASGILSPQTFRSDGLYTASVGQTFIDVYRHARKPATQNMNYVGPGKPAYNILYGDNHVATAVGLSEAFRAVRQRFPG